MAKASKAKSSREDAKRGSDLIRLVQEANWDFRRNAEMVVAYPPSGEPVTFGVGAGDWRVLENNRTRLARSGLFDQVDRIRAEKRRLTVEQLTADRLAAEKLIDSLNESGNQHTDSTISMEDTAMAPRKQALLELAERCQRVGWPTRTVGVDQSHILVTPPGGRRPITIATGSSVSDYPKAILAKLTRAGLLDSEARKAETDSQERATKLSADRARNGYTEPPVQAPAEPVVPDEPAGDTEPPADPETGTDSDSDRESGVGPVPGGYTHIEGVPVAEWMWAVTPVRAVDRKCIELLLEDSSVRYACLRGDFVGNTWQSVAKHRSANHPEMASKKAQARAAERAAKKRAATWAPQDLDPVMADMQPLFPQAHLSDQNGRLAQLLGSNRVSTRSDRQLVEAAGSFGSGPPQPRLHPIPAPLPAPAPEPLPIPDPGPAPAPAAEAQPEPQPEPEPVPQRKTDPEPVVARTAEPAPPIARVSIAAVAAATASQTAGNLAAAATVTGLNGVQPNLAELVTKLQRVAGLQAENQRLAAELDCALNALEKNKRELDLAKQQGATLADQCITKDNTIRRLRGEIDSMTGEIAAARQVQTLLSAVMGGAQAA